MSLINIHISFYLFHLANRITWVLLENKFDNFQINLLIDKRTTFSVVRIEFNLDSSVSEWTGSIGSFISYFLLSPHFITTEIKVYFKTLTKTIRNDASLMLATAKACHGRFGIFQGGGRIQCQRIK